MASKYQNQSRDKRQNIYGDINPEEDEEMEDIYDNFLMISSLESNYAGSKIMFGGNKN